MEYKIAESDTSKFKHLTNRQCFFWQCISWIFDEFFSPQKPARFEKIRFRWHERTAFKKISRNFAWRRRLRRRRVRRCPLDDKVARAKAEHRAAPRQGGGEGLNGWWISRRSLHGGWFTGRPSSGRCSPSGRQFSIASRQGWTWIPQARAHRHTTHVQTRHVRARISACEHPRAIPVYSGTSRARLWVNRARTCLGQLLLVDDNW